MDEKNVKELLVLSRGGPKKYIGFVSRIVLTDENAKSFKIVVTGRSEDLAKFQDKLSSSSIKTTAAERTKDKDVFKLPIICDRIQTAQDLIIFFQALDSFELLPLKLKEHTFQFLGLNYIAECKKLL